MAPQKPKRDRPVPTTSQRSKKRQKVETIKDGYAPAGAGSDVRKVPVALDSLPWNEVEMPDMFEDAEGFFGLDEVDNVEVLRDGNQVKFVTKTPIDDSEFQGFDDDVPDATADDATKTKPKDAKAKAKKAKADSKAPKSAKADGKQQSKPEDAKTDDSNVAKPKKETKKEKAAKAKDSATKSKDKKLPEKQQPALNVFAALQDEAEDEDMSEWAELNLSPAMLTALAKIGFKSPTPIQQEAIPEVLSGNDVIGKASTGSGKTLAFGIPIIERWLEDDEGREDDVADRKTQRSATALILSPTRELAHQLTDHLTKLCKGLSDAPYIATVTGGLAIQKQQRQLARADIIIGTPGRLWEVLSSGIELSKSLKTLKFLVVDEADRLLTEGHFKEAEEIISKLDRHDADDEEEHVITRQTLVFSATLEKGLQQKLSGKGRLGDNGMEYLMKKLQFKGEPKFIDVATSAMAEGLKEGVIECGATEKDLYLYTLLLHHPNLKTIIFTNSIHTAQRLTPLLANLNYSPVTLHSNMPQKARLRSIEKFSTLMVATDVAARGLDLPAVELVIHYHLPRAADMYVHRSGRTARAGAKGTSIMLCAPEEAQSLRRLAGKVGVIRTLDIDRRVVALLRPRVVLAKKIADAGIAKSKGERGDEWARKAAEELGVDYDSDDFERKGKVGGRARKEKEARGLTKDQMGRAKAELASLLSQRINVGVSERYLTGVDVNALLKGGGQWLGSVEGME
ncbi:hypothetical protein V495_05236 [Pseudogymnoascus sp. VKM F-4514 (FW-929)]|nr:hypothetical protein V495_05236 [Pseudogymnoascus sp. VKM F-4514 (FW-929)]KFY58987.1 hypothetical protein V497_04531 [Pseudogymnoascus sp. VKM F-4516 (FW-969)]